MSKAQVHLRSNFLKVWIWRTCRVSNYLHFAALGLPPNLLRAVVQRSRLQPDDEHRCFQFAHPAVCLGFPTLAPCLFCSLSALPFQPKHTHTHTHNNNTHNKYDSIDLCGDGTRHLSACLKHWTINGYNKLTVHVSQGYPLNIPWGRPMHCDRQTSVQNYRNHQ